MGRQFAYQEHVIRDTSGKLMGLRKILEALKKKVDAGAEHLVN